MLGVSGESPQYGLIGDVAGRRVALDLNQTHTISLFGVQGGGKSYTLGSIAEMSALRIPGINVLPRPLATVIFHYSPTMDYRPEFTSMISPNSVEEQIRQLRDSYGAEPQGLSDVVLLVGCAVNYVTLAWLGRQRRVSSQGPPSTRTALRVDHCGPR